MSTPASTPLNAITRYLCYEQCSSTTACLSRTNPTKLICISCQWGDYWYFKIIYNYVINSLRKFKNYKTRIIRMSGWRINEWYFFGWPMVNTKQICKLMLIFSRSMLFICLSVCSQNFLFFEFKNSDFVQKFGKTQKKFSKVLLFYITL